MSASAVALIGVQTLQVALQVAQVLELNSWRFPPECRPNNGSSFDFIVVGAGTAGSVLANRLSANSDVTVLAIEAGGPSPIEADKVGLFPVLPSSIYDYDIPSVNDNYTAQNLQGRHFSLTQGKMLGGSSALNHDIHVHGNPLDYNHWAELLNDSTWNFENFLPYLKKAEELVDKELLASSSANNYGTNGPIKIARQIEPSNQPILNAFRELGHRVLDDISSTNSTLGYFEPLLANADGLRQSSSVTYLTEAKSRSNLCVATHTTATKIIIEDGKAIGVQVIDADGNTQVYLAEKEVIVSAGGLNSPKLLMLSGIGPKDHLESLDIDVVVDLPVGQNLQEHTAVLVGYQLGLDIIPLPSTVDPGKFPVPLTLGHVALDPEQKYPDYQSINAIFPGASPAFLLLCSNVIKFSNTVCDSFFSGTIGRETFFSLINLMMPDSRGEVLLASTDAKDDPLVHTGTYREESDLKLMAASLKDFNRILKSSYFKKVNAKLIDAGLCPDAKTESEFWECYAVAASMSVFHYIGTCGMGSVLDNRLLVEGVAGLRVADSSSFPTHVRGNPNAAVLAVAERASDFILEEWGL